MRVDQTAGTFFMNMFLVFWVVERKSLIAFGSLELMVLEVIFIRVLITDVFIGREFS